MTKHIIHKTVHVDADGKGACPFCKAQNGFGVKVFKDGSRIYVCFDCGAGGCAASIGEHEASCLSRSNSASRIWWQPIATAPVGALVLVHDDGYIGKAILQANGRWLDVECGREDAVFDPQPTEWMNLPVAPMDSRLCGGR